MLDEVRIYNRLLTADEMFALAEVLNDRDGDGIDDRFDLCPGTLAGSPVDAQGCSIHQLVPCAGPAAGGTWKNHGQFVSSVAKQAEAFVAAGIITEDEKDAMVKSASQSGCGKK